MLILHCETINQSSLTSPYYASPSMMCWWLTQPKRIFKTIKAPQPQRKLLLVLLRQHKSQQRSQNPNDWHCISCLLFFNQFVDALVRLSLALWVARGLICGLYMYVRKKTVKYSFCTHRTSHFTTIDILLTRGKHVKWNDLK